jgi:hypothetical protein
MVSRVAVPLDCKCSIIIAQLRVIVGNCNDKQVVRNRNTIVLFNQQRRMRGTVLEYRFLFFEPVYAERVILQHQVPCGINR